MDAMSDSSSNVCGVRTVQSPDGFDVPVPSGAVGLGTGETVTIRDDADVQVSSKSGNGFYVVVNNADPSNDEASHLFGELATEVGLKSIEELAGAAFGAAVVSAPIAIGVFLIGQLVSLLTPSNLTREIFIRGQLNDGTPVTYCLLI
ncbi:hypothetical protein BH160DRAFT_3559 [Burkholderia sp. H160]|nr:hypothetical protein BH160DRAFT_3559 [Burkholderia sp. H160]